MSPHGYAIVDPSTPERVARDAARIKERGLIQRCPLLPGVTDSPEQIDRIRNISAAQAKALAALPTLRNGRGVQHQVQQLAHPEPQDDATECKTESAEDRGKLHWTGDWGRNMQ
jgi:pyruvate-formate lyase-activating enzyme